MKRAHRKTNVRVILCIALLTVTLVNCKKTDTGRNTNQDLLSKSGKNLKAVDLTLIADGMISPIGLVAIPDDSKRLAVIDQVGKIWIIDESGHKLATPFMDVTSKLVALSPGYDERGLLGLAFHPDYMHNGKFYIYYTAPPRAGGPTATTTWNNLSVIAEFKVSSNPNMADMNTERRLIELDDPQSNHNGGTIAFG